MEIIETGIKDLVVIKPRVFRDDRGYFFESFNRSKLDFLGNNLEFVQDNQSLSQKDVLRGLHFQNPPYAQAKLVSVIQGSVLDVAVDIRKQSPTYGKSFSIVLDGIDKSQLFIPAGFAHGFKTLENNTIFFYKCSNYYNKESEGCLLWNDPNLNINWDIENPILSEKDKTGEFFDSFISNF
ncbi:MAG: dTDP-4-dehydrorhamnose 3,5-epimerase [Bacteroidota bacterium]|jgi:dTDP-4-dehydrorhamnose 3,5-epimerase